MKNLALGEIPDRFRRPTLQEALVGFEFARTGRANFVGIFLPAAMHAQLQHLLGYLPWAGLMKKEINYVVDELVGTTMCCELIV